MTAVLVALIIIVAVVLAVAGASVRILREYERAVVFRLGRLLGQKGPGIVLLIPGIDRMVRVDLRTVTFDIPPQDLITRDNVPAKVNAVTYFRVVDPVKSVIEVERYRAATSQIAQTTLRSVLGKADLDMLLSERERLNEALQQIIDEQTDPWGIKVTTVEIKDVGIPQGMQRAMAARRRPSASGARRSSTPRASSRPPSGSSTRPQIMSANPTALQLRYLQTLLELGSSQARRSSSRCRSTSSSRCSRPRSTTAPRSARRRGDAAADAAERTLQAADGAREIAGGGRSRQRDGRRGTRRRGRGRDRGAGRARQGGGRARPGRPRRRKPRRVACPPAQAGGATQMKPSGSGPQRLEAVQLVARHVDHVALPHLVDVVAREGHARAAVLDDHAVVVRMALARGAPARRHVEPADPVMRRAVRPPDELGASPRRRARGRRRHSRRRPPTTELTRAGARFPWSGGRHHGRHQDHRTRRQLHRELRRRGTAGARRGAQKSLRNIKAVDVVSTGLRGEGLGEWRAHVRIAFLVESINE